MKFVECPRDAMQGLKDFIPTEIKTQYINELLKVGFDTIDFGSFVSPRAIPQMADTSKVLRGLELTSTSSKLLGIVPNTRGAEDAAEFDEISYLGFPFSISETFQKRNTNATIEEDAITEFIGERTSPFKKPPPHSSESQRRSVEGICPYVKGTVPLIGLYDFKASKSQRFCSCDLSPLST